MKRFPIYAFLFLVTSIGLHAQDAGELFQQALVAERVQGDLESAIALYERVVSDYPADRAVAANALLRIGMAQEALALNRARGAYEKLINEYSEQEDLVRQARARLEILNERPRSEGQTYIRRIPVAEQLTILAGYSVVTEDGRKLADTDWDTGDIVIQDLETGHVNHLGLTNSWDDRAYAEGKAFSPDGNQLAYLWYGADSLYSVRIRDLSSGTDRSLVPPVEAYRSNALLYNWVFPDEWSPDGRHLLVERGVPRESMAHPPEYVNTLDLIDIESGEIRSIYTFEGTPDWGGACFVDDGRFVAFGEFSPIEGDGDVQVVDVESGDVLSLLSGPYDELVLACRDGQLLIKSNRTAEYAAYSVKDLRNAEPELSWLFDLSETSAALALTRDGRLYLNHQASHFTRKAYVADIDLEEGTLASSPRPVSTDRVVWQTLGWSADGRKLAYLLNDGVIVVHSEGDIQRVNPDIDYKPIMSDVRWMPDGQAFLIARRHVRGGPADTYLIDAETGEVRDSLTGIFAEGVSADGMGIYYRPPKRSSVDSTFCIRFRSIQNVSDAEVFCGVNRRYSSRPIFSPDGGYFAIVRRREEAFSPQDIVLVSTSDGTVWQADSTDGDHYFQPITWAPDGNSLLVGIRRRGSGAETQFRRTSVLERKVEAIPLTLPGNVRSLAFSNDGRRITFAMAATNERGSSEIWVYEGIMPRE